MRAVPAPLRGGCPHIAADAHRRTWPGDKSCVRFANAHSPLFLHIHAQYCILLRMRVGIAGASGYAGAELLRLCAGHRDFDVMVAGADTQAAQPVAALYPSLAAAYPALEFAKVGADDLADLDVIFLALPHGESQDLAPGLVDRVELLVDLSADFRLRDADAYPRWYGHDHVAPELLGQFVYGLPELFRSELAGSRLVAAPGCYPTAAALALAPLVRAGVVEDNRRHRGRRQRRVGRAGASCRTPRTSIPLTRTSPHTDC